jgi:hypothetical protein
MRWHLVKINKIMFKKAIFSLIVLLVNLSVFAQLKFEKAPASFQKIIFTYKQKPNILFQQKCFFLDTTMVKQHFEGIQYSTAQYPNDTTKICARIYYDVVLENEQYKNALEGLVYHTFQKITGEYSVKKNRTSFKINRNDDEAKLIFEKYLKSRYPGSFSYRSSIDYNKSVLYVFTDQQRDLVSQKSTGFVEFSNENKTKGYFLSTYGAENKVLVSEVNFNALLDPKITPIYLFKNAEYGVEKFEDYFDIYELIDVKYE